MELLAADLRKEIITDGRVHLFGDGQCLFRKVTVAGEKLPCLGIVRSF